MGRPSSSNFLSYHSPGCWLSNSFIFSCSFPLYKVKCLFSTFYKGMLKNRQINCHLTRSTSCIHLPLLIIVSHPRGKVKPKDRRTSAAVDRRPGWESAVDRRLQPGSCPSRSTSKKGTGSIGDNRTCHITHAATCPAERPKISGVSVPDSANPRKLPV